MNVKSLQEIATAITEATTTTLKKQIGEQAESINVQILEDMIIVRYKGILPPAERHMIEDHESKILIKELKLWLIEKTIPLLEIMINNITGVDVVDTLIDICLDTHERIEVYKLNQILENNPR